MAAMLPHYNVTGVICRANVTHVRRVDLLHSHPSVFVPITLPVVVVVVKLRKPNPFNFQACTDCSVGHKCQHTRLEIATYTYSILHKQTQQDRLII